MSEDTTFRTIHELIASNDASKRAGTPHELTPSEMWLVKLEDRLERGYDVDREDCRNLFNVLRAHDAHIDDLRKALVTKATKKTTKKKPASDG